MSPGSRLSSWALIKEPQQCRLVWIIHHTLYDGWTLSMIEQEVTKAYFDHALPTRQPDMKALIKYLLQEDRTNALEFWRNELEQATDYAVFLTLPNRQYKPKPDTFLETMIEANTNQLPRGVNLSTFLYCSWSLVVSRITGNSKVAFGAIVTGRAAPVEGIDRIMGPTITTIPILIDTDLSKSVQDFTLRVQEMTIRTMPYEHLGVHEIRRISTESAEGCAFQTVLVIQPHTRASGSQLFAGTHLIMEQMDETKVDGFPDQHAVLNQYGMMLELLPIGGNITVRASFDSSLISKSQVNRVIGQLEHTITQLLGKINEAPLDRLDRFDPLSQQDLEILWAWNSSAPLAVNDLFAHQAISGIASMQAEKLAVDAWDGHLTYGELELLSTRLARRLKQLGIGPGHFVPLIFRKSKWANVSMLAVMKAGGAFVPLDAEHPEGRLRGIMQLLDANIMLCEARTRDRAARLVSYTLIVDSSLEVDEIFERHKVPSVVSTISGRRGLATTDLAYAVFTSGSTGAAKGVKITHTNLATAIAYQAGTYGFQIDSRTRSIDSSSYAFDACVFNFFYTLTHGGCLCVPSEDSLKGDIGSFMSEYKVNWAQLVPSVARTITPDNVANLKSLILTGEALTRADIDTWGSRTRLLNVYGPTECTILCSISNPIAHLEEAGNIGRGRGANLWLTEIGNPNKLAPIGAVGEILIEGPIIGAGYLGPYQYPLVIDPPWLIAGTESNHGRDGALFRTGDQARYADDGTLKFIGRIGSELKLRGQRVDLIEIEDIVRRHDTNGLEIVADIVRLDWGENIQKRQMLVLFVSDRQCSYSDRVAAQFALEARVRPWLPNLKALFDAALPSYLHPEAFVALPDIPKTSSGKTDRRRLGHIGKQLRPQQMTLINANMAKASFVQPSTKHEQTLAVIWAEVLGIDLHSIGKADDFFALGGDSVRVMRLTTVAHGYNIILKASDVFKNPGLSSLALLMEEASPTSNEIARYEPYSFVPEIIDLEAFKKECVEPSIRTSMDEIEDILPANGFQVDYMNNDEEPLGLQYAYLDISDAISWTKLVDACQAVLQSFQGLRARFVHHDGKYYQIVLKNAPLSVEVLHPEEQLTMFSNHFCFNDCRQAAVSDIYTKMTLVNTGGSLRRVILRLSHMQNDGWCTPRILKTISDAYNGCVIERTPDWKNLLYYRRQTAEESRKYWRSLLHGTTRITPPLIFKPGGAKVRTLRTSTLPYFHSSGDNRRTRPTVVVNVAWALTLQQLKGHNDVIFGNVTTGRNGTMPGLDRVIGPCVNMLPMRLWLDDNSSGTRNQKLRALVESSAHQVDERTAHEGLDWDDMVENCTVWPSGMRQSSAVHFRNMAFEPELNLGPDKVIVAWYELVATPHWTTILAYPERDVLRLWLLANPAEIGDDGADEILQMLGRYVDEIVAAITGDND